MPKRKPRIDWSKPVLVWQPKKNLVVQTSGDHSGILFSGMVMFEGETDYAFGNYGRGFAKRDFVPCPKEITIKNHEA